ncbi:Inositol-tetrakisphosphate 1-kinase [Sesamum alatum]|uniref:Inositol-tetrakisphosphate 1-kinase n=1 Tax=Sesamum alatum TaxID=300844 RepID=A0AAE2CNJ4_9LAMI|nr:Inositol-tetrakisphosphate 1-kinase [Sesamum alatum]
MRMRGEIAYTKEGEKEKEVGKDADLEEEKMVAQRRYTAAAVGGGFSPPPTMKVVVVGYALTSKKVKSFLQPKLEGLARNKGILFVAIDHSKPLSDQGPFDIVLHKLSGKEWRRILEDYRQTHPNVTVLDPPDAIQHVYNRQSMLQDVADLNLSDSHGKVGVPKQLVIKKDPSSIPDAVNKTGLRLPIVAKPLVAKSHELSLAYDEFSLQNLEPPLVLQEFINHGGVLFKVYIVGEAIKVVRRFSLPDVSNRELSKNAGVYRFPRVSCAAASADEADLDPFVAELPPRPLLERLARELRQRLGLRLFNLDIIREHGTRDHYYVIDINYFPGYGKMPEYEHIFTDFLLSLVLEKVPVRDPVKAIFVHISSYIHFSHILSICTLRYVWRFAQLHQ